MERLKPRAGRAPHRPGRERARRHARRAPRAAVPRQRRAFSTLGGPVELGGEAEAARTLGEPLRRRASLERALTHGFHSYAGRMHPSIARGAHRGVQRAGRHGRRSVLRQRDRAGRGDGARAPGASASTRARWASRSRACARRCWARRGGNGWSAEAARIAEESGERARKRQRPEVPHWARGEITRFHAHVLFELLGLRELVMATARRRRRTRAAALPVVAAGQVHEGGADGAPRRCGRSGSRAASRRACWPTARRSWRRAWRRWSGERRAGTPAPEVTGRGRARAVDADRPARRWCCRRRLTPAPTTTPRFTTPGSCGWACRREEVPARAARRAGRARRRRRGRLVARSSRRRFMAADRPHPSARRPRVAGRRRRCRRRPRRERARRHRGRGGRRSGWRRSRAPRRRARCTIAAWRRSSPLNRAASTCCCSKNARPVRLHVEARLRSARLGRLRLGSTRLHFGGGGGRGAPRPSRASLESRRPQTIRAAAYASAEELPVPLRACVPPRLRHDTPNRTASMGFAGKSKRCCEPAHVRVDVPSRGTSAQSS